VEGQALVAGSAFGQAVCSDTPISFWGGVNPNTGEVIDRRHPLFGVYLSGKVLVVPFGRGSCSASGVLFESIRNGTAPAAIVLSHIDPIIALGSILGDEVYAKPVPMVLIDEAARQSIRTGDNVRIGADGSIEIN
jgi:predicted aconitase with swiveling domain